jgi:ornithine carbamoyltransferase
MNFLSIADLDKKQLDSMLALAGEMKANRAKYSEALSNKTLAMVFEKSSTRTRVSFEAAMYQLGGHTINLEAATSQLSRGESIADTAAVLGRYVDAVMARVHSHDEIIALAKHAKVPVINGMSRLEHPCQALGDLLTLKENGKLKKGAKLSYFGDPGIHVANSLLAACAKSGINVTFASPAKYPSNAQYAKDAKKSITVTHEPDALVAAKGADIIYTTSWVDIGSEAESAERIKDFMPYQVNAKILSVAAKDAIVMHPLPARRGLEITSDVLDGKASAVIDQAENRLHVQKAILLTLLK